jgi:methyltransferase (TIGR00027 family)
MDTFAFRHPALNQHLRVFEIDRPAMQAFKRQRLAEAGLALPTHVHQVPIDLEHESLATALRQSAYDPNVLACFAWLGVTQHIDRESFFATLQDIHSVAPRGSSVVFDYFDTDAYVPDKAALRMQVILEGVGRLGEPINTGFASDTLGTDLAQVGFRLVEHLSPSDVQTRYFSGRTDGYYACEHAHLAWAVVE